MLGRKINWFCDRLLHIEILCDSEWQDLIWFTPLGKGLYRLSVFAENLLGKSSVVRLQTF